MYNNEDERLKKPASPVEPDRKPCSLNAIYVCSPYKATSNDPKEAEEQVRRNIKRAERACKLLLTIGYMPIAPHLYFPQFLNDKIADERSEGIMMGLSWLEQCEELWAFGEEITEGMAAEITRATEIGLPVKMIPDPEKIIDSIMAHCKGKEATSNV